MTVLLDHAFERIRELGESDQDEIAASMLAALPKKPVPTLDAQTRAAIQEGLAQIRWGEFVDLAEIEALLAGDPD